MKKNVVKVGKLMTVGLCYGVMFSFLSCASDAPTASEEVTVMDEDMSVRTEETGMFGGDEAMARENMLYLDLYETDMFEDWDMDDDNMLDKKEFSMAFYNTLDANNDNMLDANEWAVGIKDFGLNKDQRWDWSAWDKNNDRKIKKEEFSMGMEQMEMFNAWDKNNDNMLDEKEYADGILVLWTEADDDGTLDEAEYKEKYNKYYKDKKMNSKKYKPEKG